ncbi:Uncharacterised protein [Bordetella pertussis]|nr:Uncharacterised protein [Bordetella pertussis]
MRFSRRRSAARTNRAISVLASAVASRLMMTPAPRKPMPAITPCSTRLRSPTSMPPCSGTRTNSAAPRATSMWVRSPAALPLRSRS